MDDGQVAAGTRRLIDNQWRIFFEGYWVKMYEVPADTLLAKKRLIKALTRRLFNHVEHGINIPGTRLDEARLAYQRETHPQRKRVKGAMLAGCLFNRAADVFTKLVELQAIGAAIRTDNALMHQCEEHLQEALLLGKMVLHRSGDEGIDEMWGEPFKAFAFPIEDFYRTRYLKIATTMKAIDRIAGELTATFASMPAFAGIESCISELARAARLKCETLRTDVDIFDVWAAFAVAADGLSGFTPVGAGNASPGELETTQQGLQLLHEGRNLVFYVTRARVPMAKSTNEFIERCERYRERFERRERTPRAAPRGEAVTLGAP